MFTKYVLVRPTYQYISRLHLTQFVVFELTIINSSTYNVYIVVFRALDFGTTSGIIRNFSANFSNDSVRGVPIASGMCTSREKMN